MIKTRRLMVMASLVLVALLVTTGVVFALGSGAVNQGTNRTAEGSFSTVSGGFANNASDSGATVGGGEVNNASGYFATVGGGRYTRATAPLATVAGGGADAEPAGFSTPVGNRAIARFSTVGGGRNNQAGNNNESIDASFATVAGGGGNTASGARSTVSGGRQNRASGIGSTVSGGGVFTNLGLPGNVASGIGFTIGGGGGNTASGGFSTVAGGKRNTTWSLSDTVGGGQDNTASGFRSTVGGDEGNFAGGLNSTVGGGIVNIANGAYSTVPRGSENSAQGDFSFAAGHRAQANHNGAFVWADSVDENFASTGDNQFLIRAAGGVGIGTNNPTERVTVNGNVLAHDFLTPSSVREKTNIQTIEGALEKIQSLRGVSYYGKVTGKREIGLIVEEVGELLPEVVVYEENGVDAKAMDYARLVPVLIEAVKEQQQLLDDKDAQVAALQEDYRELEARMEALEESVGVYHKDAQTGLPPFSATVKWVLTSGLGLLLAIPGLAPGYRQLRQIE